MLRITCISMLVLVNLLKAPAQESLSSPQPGFGTESSVSSEDRMSLPAPVSGASYSTALSSETTRSNYVNVGFALGSAYDSNVVANASKAVSDFSYSLQPSISLEQTRSRARWDLTYAPGFTFYQRTSSYNQANHNLLGNLEYRLSPHVTVTVGEQFSRTSNFFNQLRQDPSVASGSDNLSQGNTNQPNVIVPIAEQISNSTFAALSYQFGLNTIVGATGSYSQLSYPNRSQTAGVSDSSGKKAGLFYTQRLSGKHYVGASYNFQKLEANPSVIQSHVHSLLLFYTLNPNAAISFSAFAGPEYVHTYETAAPAFNMWSPAVGGSVNWQGEHRSVGASVAYRVTPGGGLPGATRATVADAAFRQRISNNLTGSVSGQYSTSAIVNPLGGLISAGHLVSGSASVQRRMGEHLDLSLGYTQLHQSYPILSAVSGVPGRSHAWVSLSYRLQRPLGR